jgi:hypothetical protein
MNIDKQKKSIAKHIIDVVGGVAQISRYYDKKEIAFIDIVAIKDTPEEGVMFYSTLGVSDHSIGLLSDNLPLRVELIFTIDEKQELVENMLASSAFCIINSNYKCYPGAIFKDIITSYINNIDMKHVMFVQPFLWENDFREYKTDDRIIEWLLAVPISEREYLYAEEQGSEALEELFEKHQIDIFDLTRKSIL